MRRRTWKLRRLVDGEPLTPGAARLRCLPGAVCPLLVLERQLRQGRWTGDLCPAASLRGADRRLRELSPVRPGPAVFQERGLLPWRSTAPAVSAAAESLQGKVDLFASPYLARLQETPRNEVMLHDYPGTI